MFRAQQLTLNDQIRVLGEDTPASKVLQMALAKGKLPIRAVVSEQGVAPKASDDFCLIDTSLLVEPRRTMGDLPKPGLGYAGFTPGQRAAYLGWLDQPSQPAPMAFQQLYIATLEVALLEGSKEFAASQRELMKLDLTPAWAGNEWLDRALLLSFWLQQDGVNLARWLNGVEIVSSVLSIALGHLALLKQRVNFEMWGKVMRAWRLTRDELQPALLTLRLNALPVTLGKEPLDHAIEQLGDGANALTPWRCAHRDLRIALPQPNLRPVLEPLLREVTTLVDEEMPAPTAGETDADVEEDVDDPEWNLILEFEHSRSTYFDLAVAYAQKQENYQVLMDETRRMIYRIRFRKSKLNRFWRVWDWVQPWTGTRVFLNGRELQKWQIYPYSQWMR